MSNTAKNAKKPPVNIHIVPNNTAIVGNIEAFRKALHEDIEIKCFYEGEATLLIGSETYPVKAGDVVVINPYEFHTTVASSKEPCKYHLFMVPLDYFTGLGEEELDLRSLIFAKQISFNTQFSNERMHKILMRVTDEHINKESSYTVAIKGLMMEFFSVLLRIGVNKGESSPLNKDMLRSYRLIEPAVRHIRDNYSYQFSVDDLAAICKVSKHYFCRVFKTVTGKTVMEYLQSYRIKVADTLLNNTDRNINEIAELCGFESANYFCRCYKKYYNVSPGKRRNMLRK